MTKANNEKAKREAIRYLAIVAERLAENPNLHNQGKTVLSLRNRVEKLQNRSQSGLFVQAELKSIEENELRELLQILDAKAEDVISDSVGIVSVGTALSPYRSLDFLIVLLRNIKMVNQVIMDSKLVIRKSCGYHLRGYTR